MARGTGGRGEQQMPLASSGRFATGLKDADGRVGWPSIVESFVSRPVVPSRQAVRGA